MSATCRPSTVPATSTTFNILDAVIGTVMSSLKPLVAFPLSALAAIAGVDLDQSPSLFLTLSNQEAGVLGRSELHHQPNTQCRMRTPIAITFDPSRTLPNVSEYPRPVMKAEHQFRVGMAGQGEGDLRAKIVEDVFVKLGVGQITEARAGTDGRPEYVAPWKSIEAQIDCRPTVPAVVIFPYRTPRPTSPSSVKC